MTTDSDTPAQKTHLRLLTTISLSNGSTSRTSDTPAQNTHHPKLDRDNCPAMLHALWMPAVDDGGPSS
jgi:hypothetical protein